MSIVLTHCNLRKGPSMKIELPAEHENKGKMRTARSPEDRQPASPSSSVEGQSTITPPVKNSLTMYVFDPRVDHPEIIATLPLQARIICTAAGVLAARGVDKFTAKDLTAEAVQGGLVTRQLPERIIAYYLPELKRRGIVRQV